MKLLLGSGKLNPESVWGKEGFITLDCNPEHEPDFIAHVPPIPATMFVRQWDVVEAIHFIEHLHLWEFRELLKDIYKMLKPGGKFITEQPDLKKACAVLCGIEEPVDSSRAPDIASHTMLPIFGDPQTKDPTYTHKWGWTPNTLSAEIMNAGFTKTEVTKAHHHVPGRDFRLEATK